MLVRFLVLFQRDSVFAICFVGWTVRLVGGELAFRVSGNPSGVLEARLNRGERLNCVTGVAVVCLSAH
ncbi:MAG: hypothetical protein ACK58T_12460, partial [Phycisphaerae bacterium]